LHFLFLFLPLFLFLGLLSLLSLSASSSRAYAQSATPDEILIGAIASLTGPAGEQGTNWLRGAELATEELNQRPKKPRVRLVVDDDQTVPARAVAAAQRMTRVLKVDALLAGTWDFLVEAVFPIAHAARTPLITPTNPEEIMSEGARASPYVFTSAARISAFQDAAARYFRHLAPRTTSPRRISIFSPALPFGTVQADMIEALAAEHGYTRKDRIDFPPDGGFLESVRSFALRARESPPTVVFAVADYHILTLLVTEFERLRVMPQILTTQHLDAALALSTRTNLFRTCVAMYPASVLNQPFAARYEARFGAPPRVYAAEGYDSLNFLVSAIERGIDLSSPPPEGFEFNGLHGTYRVPPRMGRTLNEQAVVLMSVQDGQLAPLNLSDAPKESVPQKAVLAPYGSAPFNPQLM
jgi:branched-chain amino acid transport system substrate-binding protein